jgi:hypothetical protein
MEHTPMPTIHAGRLLRPRREMAGLTHEQLAEAAGAWGHQWRMPAEPSCRPVSCRGRQRTGQHPRRSPRTVWRVVGCYAKRTERWAVPPPGRLCREPQALLHGQ